MAPAWPHRRDARRAGRAGRGTARQLADDLWSRTCWCCTACTPEWTPGVQRALDEVRPYLGSHAGGVEYLRRLRRRGQPAAEGQLRRLPVVGRHRPASDRRRRAGRGPRGHRVVVEGMTEAPDPALLQIGRRPDSGPPGAPADSQAVSAGSGGDGWVTLPNIGPPSSRPVIASAAGATCSSALSESALYAYRDACAGCGSSLADGVLEREQLTCPSCGARYNVPTSRPESRRR